jgi:hypothetical protein
MARRPRRTLAQRREIITALVGLEMLSPTAWRKRGREVKANALPVRRKHFRAGGAKSTTYYVYTIHQTEPHG